MKDHELVPVPAGLDAAEAVSLVLIYVTAYQMLHRSAKVKPGQRVPVHGAAGGVGSALVQLARIAALEMYGTCSSKDTAVVSGLGATPIDYQNVDFVEEIHRLTGDGVDAVFDGIPRVFREDLTTLFDLLRQKQIKPLIARTFPLAQAREAHELVGAGGVTGKVVLVTQPVFA
jgi:NADPH:quinone reductase-like Zn-dependent oxidoreductase